MIYYKKSLGQNFLTDKNIINKIVQQVEIKNRDIIEIGPGNGALTDQILNHKPRTLTLIEKDNKLFKKLKLKYSQNIKVHIFNADILKFDLEKVTKKNSAIFGNLPYNISSQILVKIIKFKKWPPKFNNLVLMFQKELAEKILGQFKSKNYGRISILSNFRLKNINKFLVSPNCFFPKPKVFSMVLHFIPRQQVFCKIENLDNIEKVTNIFFSSKRKMVNKNLKKILNQNDIKNIKGLNTKFRPSEIKPEIYYKIVEIIENK